MITILRTQISPTTFKFELKDPTTESQDYDVQVYKKLPNEIKLLWKRTIGQHKPCNLAFELAPDSSALKYFVRVSYSNGEFQDYKLNTTIAELPPVVPREIPRPWNETERDW